MIQDHVNYVMSEDDVYTIACSDGEDGVYTIACSDDLCHVKRSVLRHYYILNELAESPDKIISVPRAKVAAMKKVLCIWRRVEADELVEVLDLLIYLEPDGETLAEWIKRLPRNYVELLPRNTTVYLWEAGWRHKQCSAVVPPWLEFKLEDIADGLALTTGTLAKDYKLYLGYLLSVVGERRCYDEEHEMLVKMARDDGILPPTLMTCDLDNTPIDRLYDMLQDYINCNTLPVPRVVLERLLEVRQVLVASPRGAPPMPSFDTVASSLISRELLKRRGFRLHCRDGDVDLTLDDAKQYTVLRRHTCAGKFSLKLASTVSEASCLRLPASLTNPKYFVAYMTLLRRMQPTWTVMKQWIELMPSNYARILPHDLLVWLWKFRSTRQEPLESVSYKITELGASLGLNAKQSSTYSIYLQHLFDNYNDAAHVLANADSHDRRQVRDSLATILADDSSYGVLPPTIITCEEPTGELLSDILEKLGDIQEYPDHVIGAVSHAATLVAQSSSLPTKDKDSCTIS